MAIAKQKKPENKLKVRAVAQGFFGTPGRRLREGQVFFVPESQFSARWMEVVDGKVENPGLIEKKKEQAKQIDEKLGYPSREEFVPSEEDGFQPQGGSAAAKTEGIIDTGNEAGKDDELAVL